MGVQIDGFLVARQLGDIKLPSPIKKFINLRVNRLSQNRDYMEIKNEEMKTSFLEGFRKVEEALDEDSQIYKIAPLKNSPA